MRHQRTTTIHSHRLRRNGIRNRGLTSIHGKSIGDGQISGSQGATIQHTRIVCHVDISRNRYAASGPGYTQFLILRIGLRDMQIPAHAELTGIDNSRCRLQRLREFELTTVHRDHVERIAAGSIRGHELGVIMNLGQIQRSIGGIMRSVGGIIIAVEATCIRIIHPACITQGQGIGESAGITGHSGGLSIPSSQAQQLCITQNVQHRAGGSARCIIGASRTGRKIHIGILPVGAADIQLHARGAGTGHSQFPVEPKIRRSKVIGSRRHTVELVDSGLALHIAHEGDTAPALQQPELMQPGIRHHRVLILGFCMKIGRLFALIAHHKSKSIDATTLQVKVAGSSHCQDAGIGDFLKFLILELLTAGPLLLGSIPGHGFIPLGPAGCGALAEVKRSGAAILQLQFVLPNQLLYIFGEFVLTCRCDGGCGIHDGRLAGCIGS